MCLGSVHCKGDFLFRKRDERLKRVVEARVKGEKEKEQEKKKKIEEKMAQIEKKHDMVGCSVHHLKFFFFLCLSSYMFSL